MNKTIVCLKLIIPVVKSVSSLLFEIINQLLRFFNLITFFHCEGRQSLPLTVCGLAKVAIFTTNVDAENQCLINHKCVCGEQNRHFCQTAVSGSFSFHQTISFVSSNDNDCCTPSSNSRPLNFNLSFVFTFSSSDLSAK